MSESEGALSFKTAAFAQPTHCRRYDGRVAAVTGAAQGLGRIIAKRLAEEGAKLVVCDIQEERLERAARELREETGMPFLAVGGDLSEAGVADGTGRPAHPTEVAAAVAFLGAPEASFVTGQHLGASGGVAMQ
jgi:NAD(P)-dependent dehydrogenase (short-subunit alcohol dehydrogenase family)